MGLNIVWLAILSRAFSYNYIVLILCLIVSFIILAVALYFIFANSFKRLRDIRGTSDSEVFYFIPLVLLSFTPYITFLPPVLLMLIKGKITSGTDRVFDEAVPDRDQDGGPIVKK